MTELSEVDVGRGWSSASELVVGHSVTMFSVESTVGGSKAMAVAVSVVGPSWTFARKSPGMLAIPLDTLLAY
jgi:hypothetical protein